MPRFKVAPNERPAEQEPDKDGDSGHPQQQQSVGQGQRETFNPELFNMNFKFSKPAAEAGDCRRSFIPALRSARELRGLSQDGLNCCAENSGGPPDWRAISNALLGSRNLNLKAQTAHSKDDDSSENENTANTNSARTSAQHAQYKASPRTESSHSFNEELLDDSLPNYFSSHHKKSSTMVNEMSLSDGHNKTRTMLPNTSAWSRDATARQMNFIMLLGLVVGILISKALRYLQLYFGWFQAQVQQLRIAFLGHGSILDFFNFDDNSRFGSRTKLLLMPLVGVFSLLYGLILFLHHLIRCLLTQAPPGLIDFIQNIYTEG